MDLLQALRAPVEQLGPRREQRPIGGREVDDVVADDDRGAHAVGGVKGREPDDAAPHSFAKRSAKSGYACQPCVGSKVMSFCVRIWTGGSPFFWPSVTDSPAAMRASASIWAHSIVEPSTPTAASHWPFLMYPRIAGGGPQPMSLTFSCAALSAVSRPVPASAVLNTASFVFGCDWRSDTTRPGAPLPISPTEKSTWRTLHDEQTAAISASNACCMTGENDSSGAP
jgi:hypothetical protein